MDMQQHGVETPEATQADFFKSIRRQGIFAFAATLEKSARDTFFAEVFIFLGDSRVSALKRVFESDFRQYQEVLKELSDTQEGTLEGEKKSVLNAYISSKINTQLRDALLEKENLIKPESEILLNEEEVEENDELAQALRSEIIDPIVYFHTIQTIFRKHNYILTFEDIGRLKKILGELEKGRMIFLSGDTGSGKTELAMLTAELFLEQKGFKERKPILIGGSRESDLTDFTLEKVISSENMMKKSADDLVWGEKNEETQIQDILGILIKKQELKREILTIIDQEDYSSDQKEHIKSEISSLDFDKYNIFTKYHVKGLIKAMHDGVPLIIDEMNAIRPEVLIGLNHYLTRKVGQQIRLPNGLGSFEIKEGFCILATGNDKDANKKKEMYTGRYKIDESLINRMSIIEKGYMQQQNIYFSNDNIAQLNEHKDTLDYLNENEIYGVLLMLLFEKNTKKSDSFTAQSKTGFDLMKEQFVGKSSAENKELLFTELKKLAVFIKMLQNAYERKYPVLCDGVDISNLIEKRVFSMRNVREIMSDYQKDSKSLFYHIYNKYVSQGNGNEDEQKALFYALKSSQLLPFKVSGSLNLEGDQFEHLQKKLYSYFLNEKNSGNKKASLLTRHDKKIPLDSKVIESKLLLTKQDIYTEYFGRALNEVDDSMIISEKSDFPTFLDTYSKVEGQNSFA